MNNHELDLVGKIGEIIKSGGAKSQDFLVTTMPNMLGKGVILKISTLSNSGKVTDGVGKIHRALGMTNDFVDECSVDIPNLRAALDALDRIPTQEPDVAARAR
jgi:hypothetical protein